MNKTIRILALMLVMIPFAVSAEDSNRILIFAKTKGFFHTSIPKGIETIMKICDAEGIQVDTTRDASVFTADNLKKYKVVVFLNTTGDVLDDTQQDAFKNYILSGGGYVGVHAATDTEYEWSWYNKLAGAYFLSHPEQQKATIRVTDKNHPSTSMLPDAWERTDEWYNFKNISPDIKVLAWLDESTYKGGANGEKHPFIWYQEIEKGRAFYTGVGHRDDNYDEPLLKEHLLGAIRWAGKMKH